MIEIVNINSIPKLMVPFVDNSNQSQPHGINYIQYDLKLQQIYLVNILIQEYFITIYIDDIKQVYESKESHSDFFDNTENVYIGPVSSEPSVEISNVIIDTFYDNLFYFGFEPQTLQLDTIEIMDNIFIEFNMKPLGLINNFTSIFEFGEWYPIFEVIFNPFSYQMVIKFDGVDYEIDDIFETGKVYKVRIEIRQQWIAIYIDYEEIISYNKVNHRFERKYCTI